MPTSIYKNCQKIMETIKNKGFYNQIDWAELQYIIKTTAGCHPTTIRTYRKELQYFNLLKESNPGIFTVIEQEASK